ncbi:unnamed protein product [Polarella glacialis]|uniref:GH15-like domain-containing protein n=1 Tax=Polarella glacialis TaxID=89957 RepID=A0A813J4I4_POLGL|nr:unnamed protein product [Polarella glacialis]|mmetsp:Transcript_58108/g.104378  ORF Transcript_58108/g.104378 Transcript_58108/m.104378 type:complete len:670 (-) Transcript_58108:43-2052(-)
MTTVDLAVVGNGMFGGLVDSKGRYVWCCMDKFDGDPVFNCLINNNSDKTGFYDVVLEDFATSKQAYQDNSTVLVTTLSTGKGDVVEIRDFAPRFVHYDRVFRPFQIIRIVKRVQGDPRVSIRIRPTFQYNSTDGYQTRGSQHVRFCGPTNTWRVTTNIPIRRILEEMPFLVSDEPVIIIFGSDESFTNSLSQVAAEFETKTINYWKQWCNTLFLPVEYQEVLMRACMSLVMCQSEDCGGFLSSLTMGLPLGPLCPASRDARVCRLLDECLALPVLRDIGLLDVCRKFLTFAKEICYADGDVQHVYNAWGSATDIKRQWAPYLAGYRGMGEVHSGGPLIEDPAAGDINGVNGEGAVDLADTWNKHAVIYGLLAISLVHAFFDVRLNQELCTPKLCEKLEQYAVLACEAFTHRSQMFRTFGPGLEDQEDGATRRLRPPLGAGFFDDDPQFLYHQEPGTSEADARTQDLSSVHTLTSVLCWAAADRLQRVAAIFFKDASRADKWKRRALTIHEEICRHAWNPQRGAFTTYWGGGRVGPSLLRLAELGFISAEDARFRGTVRAFEQDAALCAVCLGGADGEPLAEDANMLTAQSACFTTNTMLWYCEALRSTGAPAEARRLLEAMIRSSTHRGILAEAIDFKSAEPWGNTPCTAALLSLLRVAPRLSRSWREV